MPELKEQITTLEDGDLFFFYRPKVDEEQPKGLEDVQRLYMVLNPDDKDLLRLAVIGRKKLPDPHKSGHRKFWGFIDMVDKKPQKIIEELGEESYQTKTRGNRTVPAARPAGEGRYRILRHEDHTHFVYVLELPEQPGKVQDEMNIEPQASYIISIKNPQRGKPKGAGLDDDQQAEFPKHLQQDFEGKAFADLDPPELLNHQGAEFVLIAASDDIRDELGITLDQENEDQNSADIFKQLRMSKSKRPLKPLFEGKWE